MGLLFVASVMVGGLISTKTLKNRKKWVYQSRENHGIWKLDTHFSVRNRRLKKVQAKSALTIRVKILYSTGLREKKNSMVSPIIRKTSYPRQTLAHLNLIYSEKIKKLIHELDPFYVHKFYNLIKKCIKTQLTE